MEIQSDYQTVSGLLNLQRFVICCYREVLSSCSSSVYNREKKKDGFLNVFSRTGNYDHFNFDY